MREIKFRAWDGNKKIMRYSTDEWTHWVVDFNGDVGSADEYGFQYHTEMRCMLYTGLKDKNGKEIYEGDVVKVRDATYLNPHEVRWNQCHYEINQEDDGHGNPNTELLEDWAGFIDIIGNIYENPELLRDRYKETMARRGW